MVSLLAAAALGAASAPPAIADDPDVRCYVAISLALAGNQEAEKPDAAALIGLTAMIWYYYGRMETKFPGADFAGDIARLAASADYLAKELPEDAARCGAEAERKGKEMQDLGQRLQDLAPLVDGRVG